MDLFDFSQYGLGIAIMQFVVAGVIFYLTNWLGGHTPTDRGYITLSLIVEDDTMPAFNLLFKTLTPIVQYILFVALFQTISWLTPLVINCYMIIVYYWLYRFGYYIFRGAFSLINWWMLLIYVVVTVSISIWVYSIIEEVQTIFPNAEALRDQMWILIVIFVYQVLNNLQIDRKGTEHRKERYALKKNREFRKKYNNIVKSHCEYVVDADMLFAIMIVENYNRPPLARFVENLKFRLSHKKMSLGIMQVKTTKLITNEDSIVEALHIITHLRKEYLEKYQYSELLRPYICYIAEKYNGGNELYIDEVVYVFEKINTLGIRSVYDVDLQDVLNMRNQTM